MVVILLVSPSTTNGCDQQYQQQSNANNHHQNDAINFNNEFIHSNNPLNYNHCKKKNYNPPHNNSNYNTTNTTQTTTTTTTNNSNCTNKRNYTTTNYRYWKNSSNSNPNKQNNNNNNHNKTKNYVRHITRINISDVYSQIEFDGNAEPVTKEEEIVTKKKTELTTTRQIETRVKRQVVLEDGKVIQDSGPIVHTNTTEDTDKQESETTERRNLGKDDVDGNAQQQAIESGSDGKQIDIVNNKNISTIVGSGVIQSTVARPDGLVREVQTKKVVSREEVQERLETEDVRHLGDFSDEAFVKAVNSGVENIQSKLYSSENKKELIPIGPRVVHQSTKAHKTIDTEDTDLKCLAQPDGTLVTEKKKTTEHEELFDEDLPDEDDNSTGSREKIDQKESSQRFYKTRDEQAVEYVADGKVIGKEMRYAAETEQMERDGPQEDPSDWDSLSDRVRKARRMQKSLLQQHKEAIQGGDRKDALTNRPLDFDKEEETRKGETIKWLENHFGSESRSSKESRDDDIEPTKKSYFNVTIKSNQTTPSSPTAKQFPIGGGGPINGGLPTITSHKYSTSNGNLLSPSKVILPERDNSKKYFQGISEWSERKDNIPDHETVKRIPSSNNNNINNTSSFHDELKGTLERNSNNNRYKNIDSQKLRSDEINRYSSAARPTTLAYKGLPPPEQIIDSYIRRDVDVQQNQHQKHYRNDMKKYGSRDELRYHRESRTPGNGGGGGGGSDDSSRPIKLQKEDLGYMSGSRNDLRYRKDSKDDTDDGSRYNYRTTTTKKQNGYLHREDSGYVKDSREDVRLLRANGREDSFIRDSGEDDPKYIKNVIQRDDSAYVSSSTYFTAPRSPKLQPTRTPDSGIRSPSPETISYRDETIRPTVPQRKRALEKKLRITSSSNQQQHHNGYTKSSSSGPMTIKRNHSEPPPDYSPPSRTSRSISPTSSPPPPAPPPPPSTLQQQQQQQHHQSTSQLNGGMKKYQRTRFASENSQISSPSPSMTNGQSSSSAGAAAVNGSTTTTPTKQSNKVGTAIGNSLRKLVGKIRSASAERKIKLKSKRSPSPHNTNNNGKSHQQQQQIATTNTNNNIHHNNNNNNKNNNINNVNGGSSTYQQYNVIDSHIVGGQQQQQQQHQQQTSSIVVNNINNNNNNRESSIASSSRRDRTLDRRGSSDIDNNNNNMLTSPKQRYYLGEDPYGGSIYGKENKYDGVRPQRIITRRQRSEDIELYSPSTRNTSSSNIITTSNTLGRFSKSTNRLQSTPTSINGNNSNGLITSNSNSNHINNNNNTTIEYGRNTQTLPRKLNHDTHTKPLYSSAINVSIVNNGVKPPLQNTGPAKPARTYKSLNRSKSFNVHGLNGTNDPSPIYMEKLNRNFANTIYKSNPHLNEEKPQLKSPSIVNLISRSQRDLTKIDEDSVHSNNNSHHHHQNHHHSNGYVSSSSVERRVNGYKNSNGYVSTPINNGTTDKRSMFLKGLQDQAPELYKTLHGDEDTTGGGGGVTSSGTSKHYNKYGAIDLRHIRDRERESSLGSRSPVTINKDTASIIRRGSSSTDDYSETYKITSKSDDPLRPSITNTVHSFTKKTIPSKTGRGNVGTETIESTERKTVTTSRYKGEPMSNLKYIDDKVSAGGGGGVGGTRSTNGIRGGGGGGVSTAGSPIVIEVRNGSRK